MLFVPYTLLEGGGGLRKRQAFSVKEAEINCQSHVLDVCGLPFLLHLHYAVTGDIMVSQDGECRKLLHEQASMNANSTVCYTCSLVNSVYSATGMLTN